MWWNDFQSWGGQVSEVKNRMSAPAVALARCRGMSEGECAPSGVGAFFFLNVVLNIAIWCTIFHHVKQQHVYWGVLTLEQDGQKSGGVMPPSLKSEGVTDMNFLHLFVALLQ